MKESKYNIYDMKDLYEGYVFNTLSQAYAKIDKKYFLLLRKITSSDEINYNCLNDDEQVLYDNMVKNKFVVEDTEDELKLYLRRRAYQVNNNKSLKMVIAPTLQCNFGCPYCYEKNSNIYMDKNTINEILSYIENTFKKNIIERLIISWYGGEPLLGLSIIEILSKQIIDLCHKYKINFYANIISNGYLINEKVAQKLHDLKIYGAQITIDGTKDIHNKRRFLKNNTTVDTYSKIISGINHLLDNNIKVSIRINVDKNNKSMVEETLITLVNKIKNLENTNIYVAHVFDEDDSSYCLSKEEFSEIEIKAAKLLSKLGLKHMRQKLYPKCKYNFCSATIKNNIVISPTGEIFKCWNDICTNKYSIGKISDHNFSLSEENEWLNYKLPNRCLNCKYLPLCSGGCPRSPIHFGSKNQCESIKYNISKKLSLYCFNK